jgi:uncharacterized protein
MLGYLDAEEIETLLSTNAVGRIGCSVDSKVYVVPITYVYDEGYALGHTVDGLKIEILRKNPQCCFEVDEITNISNWKSVIAWGTFEELAGPDADRVSEKLHNKLASLLPSETSFVSRMGPISSSRTATQTNNPVVYRIKLLQKTGRYEKQ